jgi:hypothetical protein
MGATSINKGKKFERDIAKSLSDRFVFLLGKPKGFMRNPSSGAYFGGKNQHRAFDTLDENVTAGDIIVPKNFKFTIECKHYATPPSFKSLIEGASIASWDKWIKQSLSDKQSSKKDYIMVVMKYDRITPIVLFDEALNVNSLVREKMILLYKGKYPLMLLVNYLGLPDDFSFHLTKEQEGIVYDPIKYKEEELI